MLVQLRLAKTLFPLLEVELGGVGGCVVRKVHFRLELEFGAGAEPLKEESSATVATCCVRNTYVGI